MSATAGTFPQASPGSSTITVAGTAGARYLGPLVAPVDEGDLGIVLRPPRAADVAAITPTGALERCLTAAPCPQDAGPARMVLTRLTSRDPATINPDGTTTSLVVDRLAYVMRWDDEPCAPTGVPGGPDPTTSRCVDLELVDATTGAFLYGTTTNASVP